MDNDNKNNFMRYIRRRFFAYILLGVLFVIMMYTIQVDL